MKRVKVMMSSKFSIYRLNKNVNINKPRLEHNVKTGKLLLTQSLQLSSRDHVAHFPPEEEARLKLSTKKTFVYL